MANPEHLQILQQGVVVWNQWRRENRGITPNLSRAELVGFELGQANLREANLDHADLTLASLSGADLTDGILIYATLSHAALIEATLVGADLRWATLHWANFVGAKLGKAKLGWADVAFANFTNADLSGADATEARLMEIVFSNTDLTAVRGLETCRHGGRSTIDHRTLARSGPLPLAFLRGCGLPDALIDYLPSLLNEPFQFYSCFISYASKDHPFAERLYADLQNKGVRCWFAPEDMKIGDRIRPRIDETIRLYDKLLLILSRHSVASQWVEQEVETALARERQQGTTILFPVRIDNTVMALETGWPALIRNTRNIGDFRRWKTHDAYHKAFDRLLRDLKAAERQPEGSRPVG
jgi:hypothetical protein